MSSFGTSTGFYDFEIQSLTQGSNELNFAVTEGSKFAGFGSGDPYCEMDETTRGVSMAQSHGADSFWLAGMNDCNSGSFLSKGPTCTDDSNLFLSGGGYDFPFFNAEQTYHQEMSCSAYSTTWQLPVEQSFEAHHVPPCPPASQHFFFVTTTMFLDQDCSPQKIGNGLLDFFTSQVVASVTKVRLEKYAIKAEVFVDGNSCLMKAKVYSHGDKYAVEVQRRAGDAFVLQSTFSLLSSYLEARCGKVSVQDIEYEKPLMLPPLPEADIHEEIEDNSHEVIAPVLAMATIASLQAESASILFKRVKEGRSSAAPFLSAQDEVASALTQLLASDSLDTVYPAARCVSELAAFGEAGPLLAHQGLLQEAATRAVTELTAAQGLVGTALAQAVVDAVRCCAASLTPATAFEIQEVLDAGLKNEKMMTCDVVARSHLEQALSDTRLIA